MTSARTIRKNHKTRTFISRRQLSDDWVWGPYRSGLAYGDVRSHQKRRHAPVGAGTRALNTLPCDALHLDRKEQKKEIAAQHSANKRRLRALSKLKSFRKQCGRRLKKRRLQVPTTPLPATEYALRRAQLESGGVSLWRVDPKKVGSINPMTPEDFKKFKEFIGGAA